MQRQLRLGDILDDYCPRERRLTNHAVVAMVGPDVKQTRCTTCDAEHEYKHAKVPRQRKKGDAPAALYAQVLAGGPKKVAPEPTPSADAIGSDDAVGSAGDEVSRAASQDRAAAERAVAAALGVDLDGDVSTGSDPGDDDADADTPQPDGRPGSDDAFVHRRLIRAQLPRGEGQPPPARPAPEFTIRQPAGRPGRFRPRGPRAGQGPQGPHGGHGGQGGQSFGGRGNVAGGGPMRSGSRQHGGPQPMNNRSPKRHDPGRKRSR